MLLVTRERKRDDREEEEKTQREAEQREIPVRMNTIEVHGDVFVAARSAKTTEAQQMGQDLDCFPSAFRGRSFRHSPTEACKLVGAA